MCLFCFSIWKHTGLNCIYPLSITKMYCLAACLCVQLQHLKRETGKKLEKNNNGGWFFECVHIPFSFPFFWWISYLGVKGSLGGEGGERKQLEWGDSLIRGVHADETYLGRPCVHEAPKLPVLKHWLAVSSVSFAWIRKRLLCLSFNISKGKEERRGGGDCFASFFVGLFFSVWGDRLLQTKLYL